MFNCPGVIVTEWWEAWKDADPRDVALAKSLVPWGSQADEMVVLEHEFQQAIGARTPLGDARIIPQTGPYAPRPLWTLFLGLAIQARKSVNAT